MHEPSSTRRKTAPGALADAASHLRASLRADEADAGEADFDLPERQWSLLIDWAKRQDLILPSSFIPPTEEGGREHRVRYDEAAGLWWKITLPNLAGYTVSWSEGSPYLHNALPLDYLERLLWQNQLFGDDVMLRGLWSPTPHSWCIATTQPHVTGTIGDEHSLAERLSVPVSVCYLGAALVTPPPSPPEPRVTMSGTFILLMSCSPTMACPSLSM